MKVREKYQSPELEEFFVVQRTFLMTEMSAELPEGLEEGDPNTFGTPTVLDN